MAFREVGIEIEFKGTGVDETGFVVSCSLPEYQLPSGKEIIFIDSRYFRPTEVDLLIGNAAKAKQKLGWQPVYDLTMLVQEMIKADLELFSKDRILKEHGHSVYSFHE